jgi:small subunit ribosomal protein S3
MIERKFVKHNLKKFAIQEYIIGSLYNVGHSYTKLQKTPLGEKIIICASRPGLIVGKSGTNIIKLTRDLKEKFDLENPQIELVEVDNIYGDASIVAEMIANSLERFGSQRFKGIGHKVMTDVMNNGAMGIEIIISGKIPSARAKSWRFYQGYLKKCGDIAISGVRKAQAAAKLKTGIIGVKVSILPNSTKLPDHVEFRDEIQEIIEPIPEKEEVKKEKKPRKPKKKVEEVSEAQ